MNVMMIDLETLSLRPDAFVVQVGIALADLERGNDIDLPTSIWLSEKEQQNRHIDFDTVRWWINQGSDVRKSVFKVQHPQYMRSPSWLFSHIAYLVQVHEIEEVWASPAMFDLPVLTHLWEGRKPWEYHQERCMMTLRALVDPNRELAPPPNPMLHDAAADAQWQLQYLKRLRERVCPVKLS